MVWLTQKKPFGDHSGDGVDEEAQLGVCTDIPLRTVVDEYISLGKASTRLTNRKTEDKELDEELAKVCFLACALVERLSQAILVHMH